VREALRSHRATVVDASLALLLFGAGLWEILARPFADDVVRGPLALNLVALALATLPLTARRLAPLAVTATVFGAIGVRALASDPLEIYPPILAGVVAIYSVAAYSSPRAALLGAATAAGAVAVAAARGSGGDSSPDLIPVLILLGAVWTVGRVAGSRHAQAAEIERRAAERDRRREEEARAAAAAERGRIARELHDSVSHSLALIAMQAGGAQAVLHREPERAEKSLRSIELAAREGLTEMRRLLGLIGGEPRAELSPQPGLNRLDALVDRAREAGLDVSLRSEGEARAVPPAVDLSAYRIVQEALTNAAKHAGRCRALVSVRWRPTALELEITNDGARRGVDTVVPGRGLTGMGERTGLVGGELEAGHHGDGGYRVRVRLPLEPSR
jgi:signal transduction histidine kinase